MQTRTHIPRGLGWCPLHIQRSRIPGRFRQASNPVFDSYTSSKQNTLISSRPAAMLGRGLSHVQKRRRQRVAHPDGGVGHHAERRNRRTESVAMQFGQPSILRPRRRRQRQRIVHGITNSVPYRDAYKQKNGAERGNEDDARRNHSRDRHSHPSVGVDTRLRTVYAFWCVVYCRECASASAWPRATKAPSSSTPRFPGATTPPTPTSPGSVPRTRPRSALSRRIKTRTRMVRL